MAVEDIVATDNCCYAAIWLSCWFGAAGVSGPKVEKSAGVTFPMIVAKG
jgi:hypothetical protein